MFRKGQLTPESCTMAVLEMLPMVKCIKPKDVLCHMARGHPRSLGMCVQLAYLDTQSSYNLSDFRCCFSR